MVSDNKIIFDIYIAYRYKRKIIISIIIEKRFNPYVRVTYNGFFEGAFSKVDGREKQPTPDKGRFPHVTETLQLRSCNVWRNI